MKFKIAALCMSCILAAGSLAGCGQTENAQSSQSTQTAAKAENENAESTTVNIWIAGTGDADSDKAYKTVLDAYCKEHPDVAYELSYIPWGDYFTKLNTGLIGAAGPDIFMLGFGQIGAVQRAGNLMDLTEYITDDIQDDFYENILDICKKDGGIYALFKPANRNIFYRKDIAEQNGVTEEELHITSAEDLAGLVEKMTVRDDSGNVVTYGMELDPDEEQELFTFMGMFTEKPELWDGEYKASFNSEAGIKAMEFEKELYDTGNVCFQDATAASSGLTSGVAAMCIGAPTEFMTADSAFPGQIGCIQNDCSNLLIGDYLAVNAHSKNPEAAVDMFLHMFSKESLSTFASVAGQFAGRKSVDSTFESINPEFSRIVSNYQRAVSYGTAMHPNFGECIAYVRTAMETVFSGADVKQTFEEAANQWNAVLQTVK